MSAIGNLWRRARNPAWRYAHRSDLPTPLEWVILVLVMLIMSGAGYGYDTIRMRAEAADAIGAADRIINCVNGLTTLGGPYKTQDGSVWVTTCQLVERLVER